MLGDCFSGPTCTILTSAKLSLQRYPSPASFLAMASRPQLEACRIAAFEAGFCVPLKPGWFHLKRFENFYPPMSLLLPFTCASLPTFAAIPNRKARTCTFQADCGLHEGNCIHHSWGSGRTVCARLPRRGNVILRKAGCCLRRGLQARQRPAVAH